MIAKDLYEVSRGLAPVIRALEDLVSEMTSYQNEVGKWPRIHLGLGHYKLHLEELVEFKDEVVQCAHTLNKVDRCSK